MALKIIDYGSDEYKKVLKLRDDILRKPLGLSFSNEELENERDNMHIAAFEDDKLLACCMLVEKDTDTIKLRQMAVLNDLQGKGIGRAIAVFAENIARDRGYKKIYMDARKPAAGFYEKLGYRKVGDEIIKLSIPHFVMEKKLQ